MRYTSRAVVMCAVLGLGGWAAAESSLLKELEDAFIRLHEEVRPCVVNIDTKGAAEGLDTDQIDDLFRFFNVPRQERAPRPEGEPPQEGAPTLPRRWATGSGLIVDEQGHIITNNHVVQDAEDIRVRLWDHSEYTAKVIGADKDTDLAVIKIDPKDKKLPVAKLGDSGALKVGQFAIAIGSPRQFEGSLSFGHISALGRRLHLPDPDLRFQNFIQTDAAINLGNSGGPLCNIDGEVIGINMAIVYGANSIGFAIPINTAKGILPDLISTGRVTRGYLGVGIADARLFAGALSLPDDKGAFVKQVQPDTPAARGGLKPYDVVRKLNGEVVEDASHLIQLVSAQAPGATVTLDVWREGAAIEKKVDLAEWAGSVASATRGQESLGMRVKTLTPDVAERMGLAEDAQGVLVTEVVPNGPAEEAGIAQGDVVTDVAQKRVADAEEYLARVAEHAKPGTGLLLGLIRNDGEADIVMVQVPEAPAPAEEPK